MAIQEIQNTAWHTGTSASRWLIPVAAVAIHISIGSVYAWSTFNRPIQALVPNDPWWFSPPYITFTTAIVLLGLSAAFGGPWVERSGPGVAATSAAVLFGTGLVVGGIGLGLKQSCLVFVGMGVIAGMGCGLSYIAPVSTLVKWFPDRRGMATGMAIMGFGGGAFLALPTDLIYAVRISHAADSRWSFDIGTGHVGAALGPGINIKVNNAIAFAADFRLSRNGE